MCHCFWSNVFMREPRPRSALLVLSLDTFKAVTRLPGLSTQVSSPERQGPAARICNKTVNKHKNYTENVPHQTLTHRESRQVCFLVSKKISSQRFFDFKQIFYRNSTKMKSETSPIVSSFKETGDKVTISEHQKTNKEDMLQKFPPKNILQKRFYSNGGRLNWLRRPSRDGFMASQH